MTSLSIILICFYSLLNTSTESKPIVFKKSQEMILDAAHAKWLKAEAAPAWMLEIEGVNVTIKRPYSFYKGQVGKGQMVFVVKGSKAKFIKLTPEQLAHILGKDKEDEPDSFEVVEFGGSGAGYTDLLYCSCAGATVSKEGDGCFFYEDPSGGLNCDGECGGKLSGSDCGLTLIDFTPGSPPKKIRSN